MAKDESQDMILVGNKTIFCKRNSVTCHVLALCVSSSNLFSIRNMQNNNTEVKAALRYFIGHSNIFEKKLTIQFY